jgi:transcriptional regulator with XRE-family HTH domain
MKITGDLSDDAVLGELGARLARTRLEQNVTQQQLAKEAGVSKATVERIETGREVRTGSLIRVLRAAGRLEALDSLFPEPLPNPIERARRRGKRRQRARSRGQASGDDLPWRWGAPDEPDR